MSRNRDRLRNVNPLRQRCLFRLFDHGGNGLGRSRLRGSLIGLLFEFPDELLRLRPASRFGASANELAGIDGALDPLGALAPAAMRVLALAWGIVAGIHG